MTCFLPPVPDRIQQLRVGFSPGGPVSPRQSCRSSAGSSFFPSHLPEVGNEDFMPDTLSNALIQGEMRSHLQRYSGSGMALKCDPNSVVVVANLPVAAMVVFLSRMQ